MLLEAQGKVDNLRAVLTGAARTVYEIRKFVDDDSPPLTATAGELSDDRLSGTPPILQISIEQIEPRKSKQTKNTKSASTALLTTRLENLVESNGTIKAENISETKPILQLLQGKQPKSLRDVHKLLLKIAVANEGTIATELVPLAEKLAQRWQESEGFNWPEEEQNK